MTRIVYLCEDRGVPFHGIKGSSIHVRSMVEAFAGLGARVTVLSSRLDASRGSHADGVELIKLVIGEDGKTNALDALSTAREEGPIDAVYERLSLSSSAGSQWCRAFGTPHWLEVNAPLAREAAKHRGLSADSPAATIERETIRHADMALPVSPWLRRWILGMDVSAERVRVLPNGVNEAWLSGAIKAESIPGRGRGRTRIGFVGSLRPWHDVETLVDAMQELPADAFELRIVGDGPGRGAIGERISRLNLEDRANCIGAVAPERVREEVDAMDICVAPHPALDDFYFCPIKLLEYAARMRPVVTCDVPEIREQFPAKSLELYRPGDAGDLAAAIRRIGSRPERASSKIDRLFDFAAQHTWRRHAAQVLTWGEEANAALASVKARRE